MPRLPTPASRESLVHPTRLLPLSGIGLLLAAFPQNDLVLVDHGGASDLGWCD